MATLTERHRLPEIMDQPGLDPEQHASALRGLARINFWSGSARILWPPLAALAREMAPAPVRILDVASGAGDVPIRLWRRARRHGLALEIAGCDVSPVALDFARRQAAEAGSDIHFFRHDALSGDLPTGHDVLLSSLFLHHLDNGQAIDFLRRMGQAAGRLVLVNDLVRSRVGLMLAHVATRLLSTSGIVHVDGPRSVEAAFTPAEALGMAQQAGLAGATVGRRWPYRYLLSWRRP
jgi:2-polyprenyl-3-methyl-5-hydroxy-6-metoxy-1,4-benzoquinol methylase